MKLKKLPILAQDIARTLSYDFQSAVVPVFPFQVDVEVTNLCNLKCVTCALGYEDGMKRKKGFMDFELFKKIADQLEGRYVKVWLNGIGEPLMHKHIVEMTDYISARIKYKTAFTTNGILLTEDMSRKLLATNIHTIKISFDATDKDQYARIRIGGDFEKVVENTLRFLELKKELIENSRLPLKLTPPQIIVSCLSNLQGSSLDDFHAFWKDKDVLVYSQGLITYSGEVPKAADYQENAQPAFKTHTYPCRRLWGRMTILQDGQVSICCLDVNGTMIIGDANKESLKTIWNGYRMKQLRKLHTQLEHPGICASCLFYEGRVPSRSFLLKKLFTQSWLTTKQETMRAYSFITQKVLSL